MADKTINDLTAASSLAVADLFEVEQGGNSRKATGSQVAALNLGAIHCYEEQNSGTAGGGSTANTWVTRVLNTTKLNTITGASLSSNEITLPAGTYDVWARAPCYSTGSSTGFKLRLYDVTGAAALIDGTSIWASVNVEQECHVQGRFTLSVESAVRLEMNATASRATNGFGVNAGITGVPNHFSDIFIRRIA